ncbi:MAG: primosomal protein N' [Pseudomonadota bacterium]
MSKSPILRVAIDTPLARLFDYAAPAGPPPGSLVPGVRVRVPFGPRKVVGVLIEVSDQSELPPNKLRRALSILDTQPVLDAELLELLRWAWRYYRHPPGEVLAAALPASLRKGGDALATVTTWHVTPAGRATNLTAMARRAPKQAAVLATLCRTDGATDEVLSRHEGSWRAAAKALLDKGLAEKRQSLSAGVAPPADITPGPQLNAAQRDAVTAIDAAAGRFESLLLHGITGSGKTEVYLHAIESVIARGEQALVLVPEIGLTPQTIRRFSNRLGVPLAVLHSGLAAGKRLSAWRQARSGECPVVVGTRSAVFAALKNPGIIVVDEEHDASFKQHEGFRYSARDLAVVRARKLGIPVVLGSATPSLESLENARRERYRLLPLPQRPGAAKPPSVRLVDTRGEPGESGISGNLLRAMQRHLTAGGQVLLFLNRRGFAPAWFCTECGWSAQCMRCDARMTYHRQRDLLRCHHCSSERPPENTCPDCSNPLIPVGQGTERIEEHLADRFPEVPVIRIDRDSTRQRGELDRLLSRVRSGDPCILVGTQMLTKGHHFPGVTLVGVLNADQGLFGTDFRANERLAQMIVQVSGRAGRAERAGEVLIQTSCPEHPLLTRLLEDGYTGFAGEALDERRASHWPPYTSLALLRANAMDNDAPFAYLGAALRAGEPLAADGVELLGPASSVMQRRAGRYRAQLLVQSPTRSALHRFLDRWAPLLPDLAGARKVRWSLDVDPQDLQ